MTRLRLIQLLNDADRPYDLTAAGDPRTYRDLATRDGLAAIATYADGIGPSKNLIIPRMPDGALGCPTSLVADAHARKLLVHPWTFRAENDFLPRAQQTAGAPSDRGDLAGELLQFFQTGIDGFFLDQPDLGVRARDAFAHQRVAGAQPNASTGACGR
jgi:glycerophosphoryl diester phosphodiesterase